MKVRPVSTMLRPCQFTKPVALAAQAAPTINESNACTGDETPKKRDKTCAGRRKETRSRVCINAAKIEPEVHERER